MFWPRITSGLPLLLAATPAFAVNPLVTDDADTVDRGQLQLNTGWEFSRTASTKSSAIPLNPVYGIAARGEFGLTFGYQWRDGTGHEADGLTDLTLETKWRLLGKADDNFKVSARFDLKLPTAPDESSLGTGKPDADLALIATRTWGKTSMDWNIAYDAVDLSRGDFRDDRWFLGQAVRQQLNDRWTLIGETYATLPQGRAGAPANFNFDGGAQFALRENITLSLLVGSASGRNSPDLTSYLGLNWTF